MYRTIKGKQVKISTRELKATIMKANNWTAEQYRKQYDLFKNKLRAYESYKAAHLGYSLEQVKANKDLRQSPQELLYKAAKAKLKYGADYEPSEQMKRIQRFSAESITKGWKKAQDFESTYSQRRADIFAASTQYSFKDFIEKVPKAKEIDEAIEDPVRKEEALKALADHIKAKMTPTGEIKMGETYGSDEAGDDFDFEEWLEE